MAALRKPVAYLCAAVLIWTGIAAGYVAPVAATPINAIGTANASHSSAGHHATTGHAAAHNTASDQADPAQHDALALTHRSVVCIATCFESIEAKLLPNATGSDPRTEPLTLPVKWPRDALREQVPHQIRLAYWPAGPPGGTLASGTGTERVLVLNARLRN
jgi:hypothetical protein